MERTRQEREKGRKVPIIQRNGEEIGGCSTLEACLSILQPPISHHSLDLDGQT